MPTPRGGFTFDEVLPRLVAAHESGRLVPFIGAGMSVPSCTSWWQFVAAMEKRAKPGEQQPIGHKTAADELIRRANEAVRSLKAHGREEFVVALKESLSCGTEIPPQTRALARVIWPLVISTNWDNCYVAAFGAAHQERLFDVVGRSSADCQRVLNSLSTAGRSLLWSLQGFVDHPCDSSYKPSTELKNELVVGHDEYRRVTYREVHFRRAFAEVFRHRSLLFLGSGIRETYVQELFGEILELNGQSTRPHYAILPAHEVDPEFMLSRFQIVVVEYPKAKHERVTEWLTRLGDEISAAKCAAMSWSFGALDRAAGSELCRRIQFDVTRDVLPLRVGSGECLAFSVGGRLDSTLFANDKVHTQLQALGIAKRTQVAGAREGGYPIEFVSPPQPVGDYLSYWRDPAVYLVRARSRDDTRDLRLIKPACQALFDHASVHGLERVHMPLLSAGGTEQNTSMNWRWRGFPQRYSFIQMVRAFEEWRRKREPKRCLRLSVYVTSATVGADIASGRIDVSELLHCPDLRFWAEVTTEQGDFERRLFQTMPDVQLGSIASDLNLAERDWSVEVSPPISLDNEPEPNRALSDRWQESLEHLGVVPGSTLHFRRHAP